MRLIPLGEIQKVCQGKEMFTSTKTSNSLPEPGAVAHDGQKSAWILQWSGAWQRQYSHSGGER